MLMFFLIDITVAIVNIIYYINQVNRQIMGNKHILLSLFIVDLHLNIK